MKSKKPSEKRNFFADLYLALMGMLILFSLIYAGYMLGTLTHDRAPSTAKQNGK